MLLQLRSTPSGQTHHETSTHTHILIIKSLYLNIQIIPIAAVYMLCKTMETKASCIHYLLINGGKQLGSVWMDNVLYTPAEGRVLLLKIHEHTRL